MQIRKFGDRRPVRQHVGETSRVQQNLRDETDINRIMAKYERTGILTHVNRYAGEYGDFSGVPDYKSGVERVLAAEEMFMSLPAKIRDRFGNDPGNFIDFATDRGNIDEMRKMGLAPPATGEAEPMPGALQGDTTGAPNTRKEGPRGEPPSSKTNAGGETS